MSNNQCNPEYRKDIRAVQDAMDVLTGKWKISIIASLCYYNKRRFSDILVDIEGISNKMLSKELRDLEMNQVVIRSVSDTQPVSVTYSLTEHGLSLKSVTDSLKQWGILHREKIVGKPRPVEVAEGNG